MTDAQRAAILDAIRVQNAAMTANPEAARDALVLVGVSTREGELTPAFGGRRSVPEEMYCD